MSSAVCSWIGRRPDRVHLSHVVDEDRLELGFPGLVVDALVVGETVEGEAAQLTGPPAHLEADLEAAAAVRAEQAEVVVAEELDQHGVGDGVADLVVGVPSRSGGDLFATDANGAGQAEERPTSLIELQVVTLPEEPPQGREGLGVHVGMKPPLVDHHPQGSQK